MSSIQMFFICLLVLPHKDILDSESKLIQKSLISSGKNLLLFCSFPPLDNFCSSIALLILSSIVNFLLWECFSVCFLFNKYRHYSLFFVLHFLLKYYLEIFWSLYLTVRIKFVVLFLTCVLSPSIFKWQISLPYNRTDIPLII